MNATKKNLLHILLDLIKSQDGPAAGLPPAPRCAEIAGGDLRFSAPEAVDNPQEPLEFACLPEAVTEKFDEVVQVFEQLQSDKEDLAEELLNCYHHINVAFSATVAVAQNRNVQFSLQTLIDEVAHAIDSPYSYYLGSLVKDFHLSEEEKLPEVEGKLSVRKSDDLDRARDFFNRHSAELQHLALEVDDIQVVMAGSDSMEDLDYEGRGNVIILQLKEHQEKINSKDTNAPLWELENLGTLIFVREPHQQPFIAVEMNLAQTLARMGSAVLGNIIYAHRINQFYLQTIASLVRAMEAKDEYTSGHSTRVADMACQLGRYIGIDDKQLEQLHWTGLLHDIGKIGIRDEVLRKPGKLTQKEMAHIRTHPVISYKVLEPLEALQDILAGVRHHHEHFNGKGYPDGLAGEEIPLHARILQIADIWDALTSTRSYRDALTPRQAMQVMRNEAGTTMDPHLVASFLEMLQNRKLLG